MVFLTRVLPVKARFVLLNTGVSATIFNIGEDFALHLCDTLKIEVRVRISNNMWMFYEHGRIAQMR